MCLNLGKTNIVHFCKNKNIKKYAANKIFQFAFNGDEISYKLQNKYLSMVVNEHLDCME